MAYKLLLSQRNYFHHGVSMTCDRSGPGIARVFVFLTVVLSVVICAASVCAGQTADGGWFSVQVGSYQKAESAEGLVTSLKARGYDFSCRAVEIPDRGTWYRVLTGRYNRRDDAMQAGTELRDRGVIDTFTIVRTRPSRSAVHRESAPPRDQVRPVSSPPLPQSGEKENPPSAPLPASGETNPPIEKKPNHQAETTSSEPYNRAMKDFTAGRYKQALTQFKGITGTDRDEAVQRRTADCCYFLGLQGGAEAKRHYSAAIDQYRSVLRSYPGAKKENAEALYRLAGSYRHTSLYYEALMEFRHLCEGYPKSVYAPEALYMTGDLLYRTGKFDEAVTTFRKYIAKYPKGKHAREAYFGLGNCYSRMRQFNDADTWYAGALKRFPLLEKIPEDTLSQLGTHYLERGRDDDALRIFFAYLNLFPDGRHRRDIMSRMAHFFEESGKLPLALTMLSLIIDRYPESKEAQEGLIAMANIGVKNPDIAVPSRMLPGMDHYRDPIEAYETMAKDLSDVDIDEELLFRKGDALVKRGRYEEAYDSCRLLSGRYPQGRYWREGEKNLAVSAGHLINGHYAAGDYIAVADIYYGTGEQPLLDYGRSDTLYKVGMSLKNIGLPDSAARVFEDMATPSKKDGQEKKRILALAEINSVRGAYDDARKALQQLPGADGTTALTAERLMGDILYRQGQFKKAADAYSKVLHGKAAGAHTDDIRKRYADSLRAMGLYSSALVNYERVVRNYSEKASQSSIPLVARSYEGLGDCLFQKGKYPQAISMYEESLKVLPEGEATPWTIFNIGRGHTHVGDMSRADQAFGSLTESDSDEFWSRVVDYYITDREWTEKYRDL